VANGCQTILNVSHAKLNTRLLEKVSNAFNKKLFTPDTENTEGIIFDLPGDGGKSKTISHFMAVKFDPIGTSRLDQKEITL